VVPECVALRQGSHIKVAVVASRWQGVGELIGSGFEHHTSCTTRVKRLITCVMWPVSVLIGKRFIYWVGRFRK